MAGAILSTGKTDYTTPAWILDPVRAFFRAVKDKRGEVVAPGESPIDLDPCSGPNSGVNANLNVLPDPQLWIGADLLALTLDILQKIHFDPKIQSLDSVRTLLQENLKIEEPSLALVQALHNAFIGPEAQIQEAMAASGSQTVTRYMIGNGLLVDRGGKCSYENPPFGADKITKTGIQDWIWKALELSPVGPLRIWGTHIILCIPETPETEAWKNGIFLKAQGLCHLRKRVCFGTMKTGIPKAIALVYVGDSPALFKEHFKTLGRVENPSEVFADQAGINL